MIGLKGLLFLAFLNQVNAYQAPFEVLIGGHSNTNEDSYQFQWPIRKVAVIGGGPGGMITYRELIRAGFNAHIFERDSVPGGNWHYTEELPLDTSIPNGPVSISDFEPSLPPEGVQLPYEEVLKEGEGGWGKEELDRLLRGHRAPKPVWESLHSNAPSATQQITELPWPKGTPWDVTHYHLARYLRAFASYHGLNSNDNSPNISYNTRVELVEKRYNPLSGEREGWRVTVKKVEREGEGVVRVGWRSEDFDAIVVASGRYNAANIPPIKGAGLWNAQFPGKLIHSRQYRRPEKYQNQTVIVVGAAASGGEISRDLTGSAKHVLTSIRPTNASNPENVLKKLYLRRVPENVTVIGEIKEFLPPKKSIDKSEILLTNGTIITGIDAIIFATGYRYTFPFLPDYHSSVDVEGATPLVTDGSHIRGLWREIFFVEEPTIGFINMNVGIQSFYLSEYFAVALSKVWAGKARLPSYPRLKSWCEEHVKQEGGYNSHFQFLGGPKMNELIRFLIGWLNDAAVEFGGRQLDRVDPTYEQIGTYWAKARYGIDDYTEPQKPSSRLTAEGYEDEKLMQEYMSIYDDWW